MRGGLGVEDVGDWKYVCAATSKLPTSGTLDERFIIQAVMANSWNVICHLAVVCMLRNEGSRVREKSWVLETELPAGLNLGWSGSIRGAVW